MNAQNAVFARTTKMRTLLALPFLLALFVVTHCTAQNLQAGISVNLPVVGNATPVSDADKEDALIVTVTENGDTYLGVDAVTPDSLADKIKHVVAFRPEKKVYFKADARASYAAVEKVLSAARQGGANSLVLLTTQREPVQPGTLALPMGFEVLTRPQVDSELRPTLVEVLSSFQQSPTLMVNHEHISWTDLQSVLARLATVHGATVVQVNADGSLQFSYIARVIDIIRSAGAAVALGTPKM